MLLTRQLSALQSAIIAVCGLMIYGCASNGIQTSTGEQATNVISAFEHGEARLNCEVSCSGAWGSARRQAKKLYEQGLWKDLAIEVAKVGFKADQTYFYLGRAAEGLGHTDAARTYYKLGLASSYKCAGILNNCDGLVFPSEILAGINRLPAPAKAGAPVVASAPTLAVPTEDTPPIAKKGRDESPPAHGHASVEKVEAPKVDLRSTAKVSHDEFKQLTKSHPVSKNHARTMLVEKINSDPDYANDPVKREVFTCTIDGALEETFGDATELDETVFKSRLSAAMDRMKLGIETKDPEVTLRMMRCFINSKAVENAIKDNGEQQGSSRVASASLPLLDMDDLRLDMASLVGKTIRTQGVGYYMMDMFFLKKNMTDMSPILVDISKLGRDQRRQIMQRCGDIVTGCRITVRGEVGKVAYQNGLVAKMIDW